MLTFWWLFILFGVSEAASSYESANSWVRQSLGGLGHIEFINPELALMITDDGLLSTFKIKDGSIEYRYHYNENNKCITKVSDNMFAIFGQRSLDIWNFDISNDLVAPTITKQYTLPYEIVSVDKIGEVMYVFDQKHLHVIDTNSEKLVSLLEFEFEIQYTKITKNLLTDTIIFFVQNKKDEVFYSDLETGQLHEFGGCKIPDMEIYVSLDIFAICTHSASFLLNNDFKFVLDTTSNNLLTSTVSADDIIGKDVVSIRSVGSYQIVQSESEFFIINTDISETSYLNQIPIPETFYTALDHLVLFEKKSNHVYLFIETLRNILECYKDGSLIWSFDLSFREIKKAAFVFEDNSLEHEVEDHGTVLSQIISFFTSLYNSFYQIEGIDADQSFGFDKKLVVLASNDKIGVFDLQKQNRSQLNKTIELGLQIQDLTQIENKIYVSTATDVFHLNTELGSVNKVKTENPDFFNFDLNGIKSGYTLRVFGNEIHGVSYNSGNVKVTWRQKIEDEIVAILKRSYDNSKVAQTAVILQNRDVLYKYLVPNLVILLTKRNEMLDINLINVITGQTIGTWSKNYTGPTERISGVFEENYIILTLPYNGLVDETELVVIDLYESLTPNKKLTDPKVKIDDFKATILPAYAMQSFIIGEAVDSIAVTSTKYNIAQRALAIQVLGSVYMIPKTVIEGRRGGYVGDLKDKNYSAVPITSHKYSEKILHQWKYEPVLFLTPKMQVNEDMINISNENSQIMFTETKLASTSYLISFTEDIFVTKIQPSGSFDKLTDNFQYNVIASTIITLLILIIYFKTKSTEDVKWII